MVRLYEDFVKIFADKGCKLISTKDEMFSTKNVYKYIVKFIASCGHNNSCSVSGFVHCNYGILCKECAYKNVGEKLSIMNSENVGFFYKTEYEGFEYLRSLLGSDYKIEKANEGCLADCIVKPINEDADKWMKIQLKVTKVSGKHEFSLHKNEYIDCLIVCISLGDQKIWMIDWENVKHLKRINIGMKKSKYDNCEVTSANINEILLEKYKTISKCTYEDGVKPIDIYKQRECFYQKVREDKCSYLIIKYPDIEHTKTDCYINGYKIQEKVASICKKWYNIQLKMHNGKINKKMKYKCYDKGDNDFYWVWIPNENDFYIFPEQMLIDNKSIQENNNLDNNCCL